MKTDINNSKRVSKPSKKIEKNVIACLSLGILANIAVILGDSKSVDAKVGDNGFNQTLSRQQSSTINYNKVKLYKHKVIQGDILSKLAIRYNTSVSKIMYFNKNITHKNQIFIGMEIMIPINIGTTNEASQMVKKIKPRRLKERKIAEKIISTSHKNRPFNYKKIDKPNKAFTPDAIESIISNRENFTVFFEYGKIYHPNKIQDIKNSKITSEEKRRAIVGLFLIDNKIYGNRYVIRQIQGLNFSEGITGRISKIFDKILLDVTPNQVIDYYSRIENSGGIYNDYLIRAKKEKNTKKRRNLIINAINKSIGAAGEAGPLQITGPWLETEKKYGMDINGKYIKNINLLKQKLYKVCVHGIENGYSIDQINQAMGKIDIRFNIKEMSRVILFSFCRINNNFQKMGKITNFEQIMLTLISYNRGEGAGNKIAKKIQNNKKVNIRYKDTVKRMNGLRIASIQNKLLKEG